MGSNPTVDTRHQAKASARVPAGSSRSPEGGRAFEPVATANPVRALVVARGLADPRPSPRP